MPRKTSVRPRLKYDEDDYRALQRMDKLRVDWDSHEDNILLVCKVATMYLWPNPRKQMVSFIVVRDVLRKFSYNSYNKTSRACQRRLLYMLRQPRTMNSVALGVEEIKQDPFVDRRYSGVMERLKAESANPAEYEKRVTEVFKELVMYIVEKYYNITEIKPKKHAEIPRTKQQFDLFFELCIRRIRVTIRASRRTCVTRTTFTRRPSIPSYTVPCAVERTGAAGLISSSRCISSIQRFS
ncbi:general transcription factor 3C polypeptide 1-like [Ooceraea biroi]|uniref:general transcription factor 3C polypeptide 1-like n=1 Tax=Ooceraea biroi TaxID=2015173 RepID=UPI000F0823AE|nr:general transcription factor 3C polypeptide 1-like [Ooceraea biroi]